MSTFHDKAVELRQDSNVHHNCAESMVLTFSSLTNVSDDIAIKFTANFGKGMKMASTCGVITGGLMVLGLLGIDDQLTVTKYISALKKTHEGHTQCADLLKRAFALGMERKEHCDAMVYEGVEILENILKEKNIIE